MESEFGIKKPKKKEDEINKVNIEKDELDSGIVKEKGYLGDPRINYSTELISQHIRKITQKKELEELYGHFDDACIYLKVPKVKKIEFLEHLMKISGHDSEYFLKYLKNREPIKEKSLKYSLKKFKKLLIICVASVTLFPAKLIIKTIDNDVEEAITILAPRHLLFKLKDNNRNSIKIKAGKIIEETFNTKRTSENEYYYYSNKCRYEELTSQDLGVLVREEFCVTLMDRQFNEILSAIQGKEIPNNTVWNFNNCLYDTSKRTVLDCDKKDIFTIKNIGLTDELKDELIELDYIDNVDITPNFDEGEITLVQKTIQEILIPKYDKKDTDMYYDYLQRVGACLSKTNQFKTIPMYANNEGDNGKSLLVLIPSFIFNKHWVSIRPEQLKNDNFIMSTVLKNKNMVVFDELSKNSLKDILADIKLFSSGKSSNTQRNMFSKTTSTMNQMGMIWVTTNITPKVDTDDNSSLRRVDVLIPPNQFAKVKDSVDLKHNQYLMVEDLDERIKEDLDGLSWLVSASIKAHEDRIANNANFKCKQTPEETLNLLLDEDILSSFMKVNLEETGNVEDRVTNQEIREAYAEYLSSDSYAYHEEVEVTAQMVGNKVKKLYPNVEKAKNSKNVYYKGLKLNT